MSDTWNATHRITETPKDRGVTWYTYVMLEERGDVDVAFTGSEWLEGIEPKWSHDEGIWMYEGKSYPNELEGTISVHRLDLDGDVLVYSAGSL